MAGEKKIFSIVAASSDDEAHTEISGCAAAEPYALRVIGDSMAPEFEDGHVIIIDPALPAEHGSYVIIDYQGETTFRQFIVEGGRKLLKALNELYAVVEITGDYTVLGVVVQRAGRRRRDHKHYV